MAKSSTKLDLHAFSADELLAELRAREIGRRDATTASMSAKTRKLESVSSADLAKALREAQKVIYGLDDRQEAFEVTDPDIRTSLDGVASLIDVVDLVDNGDGTSTIRTISFGDAQGLCSSERFRTQPTSPFCTGFLVGSDLLATAGHCIDGNSLGRTRFLFGFRMNANSTANVVIPNDDIYQGIAIVAHKRESAGADYAVVRLNRSVSNRPVLPIRRTGKVADGRNVYVIGHSSGLPLKYAPRATVRDNTPAPFFVANLDTYGGNSGSPVFDEVTHAVEGILVRGETDFVLSGACRVSNVCPTTGCRGEDVTRTTEFAEFVPESDNFDADDILAERVGALEEKVDRILKVVEKQ